MPKMLAFSCLMPCGALIVPDNLNIPCSQLEVIDRLEEAKSCRYRSKGTDLYTCDARHQKAGKQSFQSAHLVQGHQAAICPHQIRLVSSRSQGLYSKCCFGYCIDKANTQKPNEQCKSRQDLQMWDSRNQVTLEVYLWQAVARHA